MKLRQLLNMFKTKKQKLNKSPKIEYKFIFFLSKITFKAKYVNDATPIVTLDSPPT